MWHAIWNPIKNWNTRRNLSNPSSTSFGAPNGTDHHSGLSQGLEIWTAGKKCPNNCRNGHKKKKLWIGIKMRCLFMLCSGLYLELYLNLLRLWGEIIFYLFLSCLKSSCFSGSNCGRKGLEICVTGSDLIDERTVDNCSSNHSNFLNQI